jgi:hypothetical protein
MEREEERGREREREGGERERGVLKTVSAGEIFLK